MKYRSRTDIIRSILGTAINGGATKTRLMYGAYLSYYQIEEYLDFLIGKKLIQFDQENRLYKLTQRGLDYLHKYNEISELLDLGPQPSAEAQQEEFIPKLR